MAANNSQPIRYYIAPQVFDHFPGYFRAVVLARGVANIPSPAELISLLRAAEEHARRQLDGQDITAHARISAWREAYRSLGIKPAEYRPSMEAMLRRVLNGRQLPAINALVDIGNIVSLRHLLPVGGHAIDGLQADIALRPAHGREVFIPFVSGQPEHPEAGEFIFAEADTVLTRRWTWRQSSHTMTTLDTSDIEFNVDALPPVSQADAAAACREISELTARFCGGQMSVHVLSRENPSIRLRD